MRTVRLLKQRVRRPLLTLLRSLAGYRKLARVPRNDLVGCREYVQGRASGAEDSFTAIHPPRRIEVTPDTGGGDAARLFGHVRAIDLPETFVASLARCRLYGRGVAVIGADGRVIAEASAHIGGTPDRHAVFARAWLPRPIRLPGATAVLSAPAGNTYYHWLLDVLPRIALLRLAGVELSAVDRFAVNSLTKRFQRDTLASFGIDATRVVETDRLRHLVCERMIVPSYAGTSGFPPRWACDFLRESFLDESDPPRHGPGPERIYVSRQRTPRRRVHDPEALDGLLVRAGFVTVFPEDLTVPEQARLFRGARAVVAPHGSGLSNLVFCSPGTAVVEIFPPGLRESHYWVLSRLMGIRYRALVAAPGPRGELVVPLTSLERAIEDGVGRGV